MNGVNLIPAGRRDARRRAERTRAWMIVAPVCASLLAGAYAGLRIQAGSGGPDVTADLAAADASIACAEKEIKAAKAEMARLQPRLKAARAVGSQPDWGALLNLLASALGEHAVLNTCALVPSAEAPPAAPALARSGRDAAHPQDYGRPERFTLTLAGTARSQEAMAAFVRALEGARLFDRVTLLESRRTTFASQDAVAFRVECLLTDPIMEAP